MTRERKSFLKTPRLVLRPLSESDVTREYVDWLNDPQINRFLESRFYKQTITTVKRWVRAANNDPSRRLWGIFIGGEHIGNVTLYMIEPIHRCLRVGISIGKKAFLRQGLAAEALQGAVKYVFQEMGYNRIEAGVYQQNVASIQLFKRAGFHEEARFRQRLFCDGAFMDMLLFVMLKRPVSKTRVDKQ